MQKVSDNMCENGTNAAENERKIGRIDKEALDQLVAYMIRNQLWATPEETAEWLKTETGQRIAALIEKERKARRKQ